VGITSRQFPSWATDGPAQVLGRGDYVQPEPHAAAKRSHGAPKPPGVSAGEARGRKTKIYTVGKSDRVLPAFAEPAAKQAGDERHEANCKEVHDCEVARDQERDQHGDGGRDARLQDRPSRRLEPDDEAADGEGEEVEQRGEYDLPPAQLDILGPGDAFKLRSKKKPQDQAGDQVKHDHHDHADADPLPVQCSGHFLLLFGDAGRRGDLLGCGDGAGPDTHAHPPALVPTARSRARSQPSRRDVPCLPCKSTVSNLAARPTRLRNTATALRNRHEFQQSQLTELATTDFESWAKVSFEIATKIAYQNGGRIGIPRGGNMDCTAVAAPVLPVGYVVSASQIADRRMILAGYRLADLLTRVLEN
jgi:hypothetical protein